MKRLPITLSGLLLLAGCSSSDSGGENTEAQKRLKVCEAVMKKYIVEAHLYERDWKKTIGSCNISQLHRTLEQWECVLAGMEGGEKYVDASDRCGSLKPVK